MKASTINSKGEVFYVGDVVTFNLGSISRTITKIFDNGNWSGDGDPQDRAQWLPDNLILVRRDEAMPLGWEAY